MNTETEYLRVDSNTIIRVELRCIACNIPEPGLKALLQKEVLDLAKDDVQNYVDIFRKKKKKFAGTEKIHKEMKNKGQVVRGENVKFLYEFSPMSVTHRVLTREMQKGSKYKSSEVFPEKLVIYYQPYCKALELDSSQTAISSYFKKSENQNEEPSPMKTALCNIVSKSGPKLSKVKKKKWEPFSICDKNVTKIPDKPDPFKRMAQEDEQNLDTRLKIALVKDNLLMLQEDLASRQRDKRAPNVTEESCEEKKEHNHKETEDISDSRSSTGLVPECSSDLPSRSGLISEANKQGGSSVGEEDSLPGLLPPKDVPVLSSAKDHTEDVVSEDNAGNFSGDFGVEINEECGDPTESSAPPTELDCDELPPFGSETNSDAMRVSPCEPNSPSVCDKSDSDSISGYDPGCDNPETCLPEAFAKSEICKTNDGSIPLPEPLPSPEHQSDLDSKSDNLLDFPKDSAKSAKEHLPKRSAENPSKRTLSNKGSSKTAARLSRKVAMIDLSDSDSDCNVSVEEPCQKDSSDHDGSGQVPHNVLGNDQVLGVGEMSGKQREFVFKKPKLSRSLKTLHTGDKSGPSNISGQSGDSDTSSNEDGRTNLKLCSDFHGDNCDQTGSDGEAKHHEFAEPELPDIVRKKRTLLKKRKPKPAENAGTLNDKGSNSDDLPTISASKTKLRRLGPKIKLTKSSKAVPNAFLLDQSQSAASKDLQTSNSKTTDATANYIPDVIVNDESATASQDAIVSSTVDPSTEPVIIEDDISDRLLLEISDIEQVKYLTEEQLEYLVTSNIAYVKEIFRGKRYCERHEKYKKGKRQQILLRNDVPMGQFRESQHDVVMNILMKEFCKDNPKYFDYVCKVMLPEMLVKVCMDVQNLSHEEAESALDTVNMSQMVNC